MMKREKNNKMVAFDNGCYAVSTEKRITEDVKTVVFHIILKETSTSNQAKLNSFSLLFS